VICSLMNARDCGHDAVRAYIHEVKASAIYPCHYDVQEKQISFEVAKRPCPSPHESDKVANVRGSVTRGDCKVKGIYADGKPVAEIYAEVACFPFPDSHAEGNVSRTAAAEEAGTGSARMGGGGVEKVAGASHDARGSCCAFRDASYPPRAFLDDPSPVFLAPIFLFVLLTFFVLLLDVARAPPFRSTSFVAIPPASPY